MFDIHHLFKFKFTFVQNRDYEEFSVENLGLLILMPLFSLLLHFLESDFISAMFSYKKT